MKIIIALILTFSLSLINHAQDYIHFHESGNISSYELFEDDSIYFDANQTTTYFSNDGITFSFLTAAIDSITFTNDISKNVYIDFQGTSVTVSNPFTSNLNITTNGAQVTVDAFTGIKDINYILTGTTTNGFFKIYSDKRFNIIMDNVNITNPIGPAINVQSEKDATINLINETSNSLTDGSTYDAAPTTLGVVEDQKATLFLEGDLELIGGGALNIVSNGVNQHAIASDDDIELYQGVVTISSSQRDAIHAKDNLTVFGGEFTLSNFINDGLDGGGILKIECGTIDITSSTAEGRGIKSDSVLIINEGNVNITCSADQTKAIKSEYNLTVNGGTITAQSTGGTTLITSGSGNETQYASLISSDSIININGGQLTLSTTGGGARAITADNDILITDGTISITSSGNGNTYTNVNGETDSYHSTSMRGNSDISIIGGSISILNSGTGGKGIDADGSILVGNGNSDPQVNITTTGNSITISSGGGGGGPGGGPGGGGGTTTETDESKTVKANGDVTINSGSITISSADDGIKADQSITFNNGTLDISNSVEGLEAPYITINNGTISINATDDGINATMGEEVMTDDGSQLIVNNGLITINMSGNDVDAMDSNGDITISNGTVYLNFPTSGPSEGLDANGTVTIGANAMVYENGVLVP